MSVEQELLAEFESKGLTDLIEMMEDAKSGHLKEVELVESIGLLYDQALNQKLLIWLKEHGVELIYVTDDEEYEE
jgi:N-dimethylarginine dimethylaminohydrolase